MKDPSYGFKGPIPVGVSIEESVRFALEFKRTHTKDETIAMFYNLARNNSRGDFPKEISWDFKQIDPQYAEFGNFFYGVVGAALGFTDRALGYGAGVAHRQARGDSVPISFIKAAQDANYGDDPADQILINQGIEAARANGWRTISDINLADIVSKKIRGLELYRNVFPSPEADALPVTIPLTSDELLALAREDWTRERAEREALYHQLAEDRRRAEAEANREAAGWNLNGTVNSGWDLAEQNRRMAEALGLTDPRRGVGSSSASSTNGESTSSIGYLRPLDPASVSAFSGNPPSPSTSSSGSSGSSSSTNNTTADDPTRSSSAGVYSYAGGTNPNERTASGYSGNYAGRVNNGAGNGGAGYVLTAQFGQGLDAGGIGADSKFYGGSQWNASYRQLDYEAIRRFAAVYGEKYNSGQAISDAEVVQLVFFNYFCGKVLESHPKKRLKKPTGRASSRHSRRCCAARAQAVRPAYLCVNLRRPAEPA